MNISFEEFKKCEIKMGTVLVAEPVEGSEKLLRLEVDFGAEPEGRARLRTELEKQSVDKRGRDIRQILSGIATWYTPEDLIGKQMPFIVNLEPRKMMGMESQGMLIATDNEDGAVLLFPNKPVPAGSAIR